MDRIKGRGHGVGRSWMVMVVFLGLTAGSGHAASLDSTADGVLGQPGFTTNDPAYPDFLPTANNLSLSNAAHVAVAPDGRLYVSDPDHHRVLSWPSGRAFSDFEAADLVIGQPDFVSAVPNNGGLGAGTLFLPQGVWADEAGDLWVADAFNNRVLKYDHPPTHDTDADMVIGQPDFVHNDENLGNGEQGTRGAQADSLQFPGRVIVRGADVYVVDSGNSRVLHYLNPTSNKPLADTVFGQYDDFTCRAKNNDGGCNDFGAPSGDNLFNPIGVAVDEAGSLYVADWQNNRVLRFNDPLTTDTTADAVIGQADLVSNGANSGGLLNGLSLPIDVVFDAFGSLFVADSGNNRVLVHLDPLADTVPDLVFGQLDSFSGSEPNHGLGEFTTDADGLFGPTGVALDACNDLLVADTNNHRVLRFDVVVDSPIRPDFDADCDVDGEDLAEWDLCMTGPAVEWSDPDCGRADFDEDADVDQADFAVWQRCYTGDGPAADPACDD